MLHRSFEQTTYQNQKETNPDNEILLNKNTEELLGDFSDILKYLEKTANLSQPGQFSRDLKAQSNFNINQTPSEETKLTTDDEQIIQEITWEWQSPTDPEPGKWILYNRSDTYLLEKAYLNKEENSDLGEWIVYVSDDHMFQQRKDDISKQTRVRRNNNKEEYIKRNRRMRRFIEGEKPKTYTNVFGSLGDYLSFFENRTPEMASFGELFRKAEDTQDIDKLNKEIVPIVIKCIQKEASKDVSEKKDEKKLVRLFNKTFRSFEQFYGDIIKAYTMETFLYGHLNQYLRNEDWVELNDLLPYAFCFCKAFLCPQISSNCNKHLQQSQNKSENDTENLILYRGARFEEVLLSFYDPKIVSTFSWNAVTSTSTNRCTAEFFIGTSSDLEKVPVLFEIEVPISTVDNLVNVNLLDIKTLSAIPDENEIVLAPGSVFELIDFTRDNNGAKVKLKLVIDTNLLVDQGRILHGAMHTQVSKGKIAKIIAQQGKELAEALYHLRGNLMIEEIEFTFCKFDERTLKDATEILLSLPNLVRVGLFTVISNKQTHLSTILKTLGNLRIKSIEISDRYLDKREQLLMFVREMRHLASITSLQIDFTHFENLDESMMKILCSEGLRCLTSLTNLRLTFSKCKFTDKELKSLSSEGIRALTSLTSLTLDFSFCVEVTDEGIESLTCEGLRYLTSLTNLKLAFRVCGLITDKGLKSLSSEGIRALNSLTSLTLDFSWCKGITDEGVESLTCEGVRSLTSLTSLNLDFEYCEKITNEGVNILGSQGIRHLTSLRNLSLNFSSCSRITNRGGEGLSLLDRKMWPRVQDCWMKNLFSQHLVSFTSLTLNLEWHDYIGDQEIAILCSTGLRHMTLLETLDLNFSGVHLGDHEMEILCLEGLRHLVSLTTLTLNFYGCYEITDTGMEILCSDVLTHMTSLKALTLDFTKCFGITDNGMNLLRTQAAFLKLSLVLYHEDANTEDKMFNLQRNLNSKSSRKSIDKVEPTLSLKDELIIDSNSKMSCLYTDNSEKGNPQLIKSLTINRTFFEKSLAGEIKKFYSEELRRLGALKTLTLDFGWTDQITDDNVKILCLKGLRYLTSLTFLTLDFSNCEITDEGVKSLCSEGLRHLTSLTTLDLDFCRCPRITDNGMKFLCSEGLTYLTSVTDLTISFGGLDQITDEIVKSLSSGLTHLTSLTTLHLGFLFCKQITGEGVKALCSEGLRHLNSLSKLTLDLSGCEKITDEEVKNFCSGGLRYLDSILDLTLGFGTCQISDEGLRSLCSEGLKYLTSITTLNLNFDESTKITAEGAKSLSSIGLRYLTSLITLELSFKGCEGITDVGVHNMCLEGFKHLTSLTKLLLNFDYCENMTDKGVKSLCSEGLRYLISLQSITLSFKQCTQITDQGIKELCSEGLTHLTSLTNLNLDFRYCYKISYACLEDLRKLLKYFRFN